MIVDRLGLQWVYVANSNRKAAYEGKWNFAKSKEDCITHWAKWVILGKRENLDELAHKLDPYVEERYICNVKFP